MLRSLNLTFYSANFVTVTQEGREGKKTLKIKIKKCLPNRTLYLWDYYTCELTTTSRTLDCLLPINSSALRLH